MKIGWVDQKLFTKEVFELYDQSGLRHITNWFMRNTSSTEWFKKVKAYYSMWYHVRVVNETTKTMYDYYTNIKVYLIIN